MSFAAPSRRIRPLLVAVAAIFLLAAPGTASAAVRLQAADIEAPALSQQFDQLNATVGSLTRVDGGYGDGHAAQATYSGGGQNGYSRGIFNVDWQSGDDVWYSAAYYLPVGFKASMQGQVALMRWDDYGAHPEAADYSGIVIYGGDKRSRLVIDRIATGTQIELSPAFDLPEGRWFHLEVHQRLGATSGLNEVYIDGQRVSSTTQPNLEPGRGVDRIRYGIVAIASGAQTNPLSLRFDDAAVSASQIGPDAALAQPLPPVQTQTQTPTTQAPIVSRPSPPSTPPATPPAAKKTKKPAKHYTRKVRKCAKAAMKRAERRGRHVSRARTLTRCSAKHR